MYSITTLPGYFAVVLVLAGFSVLAWQRFAWAVVAALAFIPLAAVRFSVGPLPFSVAEALALILVARAIPWAFSRLFWADIRRVAAPIAFPAAFILLGLAVSATQSPVFRTSLGIIKGWFVVPILLGLLVAVFIRRAALSRAQAFAGLVSGGAIAAFGAITQIIAGNLTYDNRLAAWYGSPNYLAMYLAPVAVLAFGLQRRGSGIADEWRTLSRWAGVLMAAALLATQSWGAIGAALLALAVGLWFGRSGHAQRRKIAAAVVLTAVLAGFVFQALQPAFTTRRVIWQVAFEIGRAHPVWGIGPGAFQAAYLANQPKHPPYPEWAVPHPHNAFLAFWLEAGLLGLVGFVWLLVVLVRRLRDALAPLLLGGNVDPRLNSSAGVTGLSQTNTVPFLGAVGLALFVPVAHGLLDTTIWHGDLAMVWWVLVGVVLAA